MNKYGVFFANGLILSTIWMLTWNSSMLWSSAILTLVVAAMTRIEWDVLAFLDEYRKQNA